MKIITHFLILVLIKSIISESLLDYFSINHFLNDLKSDGLFEIILSIKKVYGQDVAIISCEELKENGRGNCKRIVTEYMSSEFSEPPEILLDPMSAGDSTYEENEYDDQYSRVGDDLNSGKKLEMPFLDLILSKKFNSEKSKLISNKIKEKIKTKHFLRFYN